MARFKGALLAVLIVSSLPVPAAAQIGGHPFEISGGAGYFSPDMRARLESAPGYVGGLAWRANPSLSLELNGTWVASQADSAPGQDHNFFLGSADLRWNLRPAFQELVPYLLVGGGYASSHTTGRAPDLLERGAGTIGAGLLANVVDQRCYLRFQVRDVMFRERGQQEFSNHLVATAGVHFVWGGRAMDADKDGVRDRLDRCAETPIGATVDVHGCPSDADGDGVLDGLDKCNDTPKGCEIDAGGCSKDADGDGICDGVDTCPDTPKGASVSPQGCPSDSDGDGILDGLDRCPGTPKGAIVDASGCPNDADGDGVFDGLDACANTPSGVPVDSTGCPLEAGPREIQLLNTGMIRISEVLFESGQASLRPSGTAVLDTVVRILSQYPTLRVEIGAHTDNAGDAAANDALSQQRADSVLATIRGRYPGLDASRYSARGYGGEMPVAPNRTELGRAKNRRVEFRVLNTEDLRAEREKRRALLRGNRPAAAPVTPPVTPAPADSTRN